MTPAVANCDWLMVNVTDVADVSLAVTTCRNTAWAIAVVLASRRTSVQPAGPVNVGLPRAATAARTVSPVWTPTGSWIAPEVPAVVLAVVRNPCHAIPVDGRGGFVVPAVGDAVAR